MFIGQSKLFEYKGSPGLFHHSLPILQLSIFIFETKFETLFSVTDPMWTEAENNFDQFLDKFIMHELTKDENDNSNNNVSI